MIDTYDAIKDLIDEKLNANSYGIVFNTTLFDSKKISYTKKTYSDVSGSYDVIKQKCVPAHIEEIVGGYINVPNVSVLEGQVGMTFDIFTNDYTSLETPQLQELFKSVSYRNTMLAIDEMRKDLLAKFFPLGDTGIYFGGTDSIAEYSHTTPFITNTIYLELDIKDTSSSVIWETSNDASNFIELSKTATNITLTVAIGGGVKVVVVPYSTGLNTIWAFYDATDNWNLVVNGVQASTLDATTQNSFNSGTISTDNTYYGLVYRLLIDDSLITLADTENTIDETIPSAKINLKDFTSRYELNQLGELSLLTKTITDSILWGKDGNAVFGFEGIVPISDLRFQDEGLPRQLYGLGINTLISFDVLFGNLYEYFIDGEQVFPVDRQNSYGTQGDSDQYIDGLYSKHVIESNMKEMTNTFFVTSNKLLTEISKHITSNSNEQNKTFELVIQYPFYKETYEVLIDTGGLGNSLNQLATITVTYKQNDDTVT